MATKTLHKKMAISLVYLLCTIFATASNIKGRILQASNSEAIELANVVLQTNDSIFVTGTTSDADGNFTLNKINAGDYILKISSVGYETQTIELNDYSKDLDLKEIMLAESSIELGDITVVASATSSRSDRKIIFPTERILKASTNGLDVLQQMMLPKITVNALNNSISIPGNGEVQIRINGVKVETNDIKAIRPEDIIRIEFHDNPGLRYGNAEVVLDYIVRRPETGGNIGLDSKQGINAMWGEHNINAKINHKKSEFSLMYNFAPRNFYNMWRDNEEIFNFTNGKTLHRKEQGNPDHGEIYMQNAKANYSYQDDKQMANASFRYMSNDIKHMDYNGLLYNVENPTDKVYMIDKSPFKYKAPSLDIYYQRNMKNDQTLVFDMVGTYIGTNSTRIYQESLNDIMLTNINNHVDGKKYSIIGEGIYEKKFGDNRLGAGIRHEQSFSDNKYLNGHGYTTRMKQANTYAYTEWKGKIKNFDYTFGVGFSRYWLHQENAGDDYEYYHFRPKLTLQYNFPNSSILRINANINTDSPSLSNLSDIEQTIDSLQIQRGNPNLKPYQNYKTTLTYEWKKNIFYAELWSTYQYAHRPIMDEKFWEKGKIVQTWDNQKNWQRLASDLTLRVGPIKDIFQFSLNGGVNHFISNGNDYAHKYTNWYCEAQASATYKNWTFAYILNTNWNKFWGETMNGGENIQIFILNYKYKNATIGIGGFNPFTNDYKQETENWNRFASFKKSNHINESSRMFMLTFSYNFSFGRSYSSAKQRLNNSDTDAGIIKTGK